jgi:hypothetical protein
MDKRKYDYAEYDGYAFNPDKQYAPKEWEAVLKKVEENRKEIRKINEISEPPTS